MAVKAKWYKLDDQKPIFQLITSLVVTIVLGTLLYYLLAFSGTFIFSTAFSDFVGYQEGKIDEIHKAVLKYSQVAQEIALFIVPGLILAAMFKRGNESYLKIGRKPDISSTLLVVILALAMIPVTMYTGSLNSKMILPGSLSGIENWMKAKEEMASDLTTLFIHSSNSGELCLNIFILALIPAIAEEIIFRGILQSILCRLFNSSHTGIWLTAIFFSAVHIQFYGFLPRLLLGLSFGYLFYWSCNLWLPVLAHFINNLVPVVLSFAYGWNALNDKTMELSSNQVAVPLAGVFISILILIHFRNEHEKSLKITS